VVPSPSRATEARPTRVLLYAAFAFLLFWFVYLTLFGPKRSARLEDSGMSEPASYDWSALDLDDQPVAFSRFKGKPVFLNFWATWCGPCVREMPSIDSLARDPRLAGKSIEFVCISVDDSAETVRQYLQGKNFSMTFLRVKDRKIPPVFYSEGIPATFLIAPDGRIAACEVGSADWHETQVLKFMEKLAAAP
jgi:thiol-disulfide isomerase/thioredoxin